MALMETGLASTGDAGMSDKYAFKVMVQVKHAASLRR